jgi:hypothetical protein
MRMHLGRRFLAVALAALVVVGALVAIGVTRLGANPAPLATYEYTECLVGVDANSADFGAGRELEAWPAMPSPVASDVRDAFERAGTPLLAIFNTHPSVSVLMPLLAKYKTQVANDPQVISDCRAYINWKYGYLNQPVPTGP